MKENEDKDTRNPGWERRGQADLPKRSSLRPRSSLQYAQQGSKIGQPPGIICKVTDSVQLAKMVLRRIEREEEAI